MGLMPMALAAPSAKNCSMAKKKRAMMPMNNPFPVSDGDKACQTGKRRRPFAKSFKLAKRSRYGRAGAKTEHQAHLNRDSGAAENRYEHEATANSAKNQKHGQDESRQRLECSCNHETEPTWLIGVPRAISR